MLLYGIANTRNPLVHIYTGFSRFQDPTSPNGNRETKDHVNSARNIQRKAVSTSRECSVTALVFYHPKRAKLLASRDRLLCKVLFARASWYVVRRCSIATFSHL